MTNETNEPKPKPSWGDIARGVIGGMNKNDKQRPARSAPKPRKPCGGCGGK